MAHDVRKVFRQPGRLEVFKQKTKKRSESDGASFTVGFIFIFSRCFVVDGIGEEVAATIIIITITVIDRQPRKKGKRNGVESRRGRDSGGGG